MRRLKKITGFFRRNKFPFIFVYSDSYWMVELGNHVFPIKKYRLIYERLLARGVKKENFSLPFRPDDETLLLVHTGKYLKKIQQGRLSQSEIQALEVPFSQEGVDFAVLNVGGTITAAENALHDGLSFHIGGGFHHAFADHGEGFCIFNDVAIAVEKLMHEQTINRAMIVDCDVHQGNGTASILSGKEYAFTFSIHQMDIYPADKPAGSLDIGLWSGDGDDKYIAALEDSFPRLYTEFRPDLVFYLAGADPFEKDQLGGLSLSFEGLKLRDSIIINHARRLGIPVAIVLAGGYSRDIEDTVSVHINTIAVAQQAQKKYFRK